jgi:hypothetical protein
MAKYYVNKNAQSNGDHEVHKADCKYLPLEGNRVYLGDFESCSPAVKKARDHYTQVNGCKTCSSACHTS